MQAIADGYKAARGLEGSELRSPVEAIADSLAAGEVRSVRIFPEAHPIAFNPALPFLFHKTANYEAMKKYARDLIKAARYGKLDPVIGRDEEIRRTVEILARRTKTTPP